MDDNGFFYDPGFDFDGDGKLDVFEAADREAFLDETVVQAGEDTLFSDGTEDCDIFVPSASPRVSVPAATHRTGSFLSRHPIITFFAAVYLILFVIYLCTSFIPDIRTRSKLPSELERCKAEAAALCAEYGITDPEITVVRDKHNIEESINTGDGPGSSLYYIVVTANRPADMTYERIYSFLSRLDKIEINLPSTRRDGYFIMVGGECTLGGTGYYIYDHSLETFGGDTVYPVD